MSLRDFFRGLFAKKHKKIGLALGSGGAKGFALIGALKAFEEEGIKFDIVAGTSIGSIVGGLYACGHGWKEMLSFLKEYDVENMTPARLLLMKMKGYSVTSLLSEILGGKEFEDAEIPFAAVATNVNSGEEVVMKHGDIASAMAASGAIVPPFKAVERRGVKLVDGAFVNAVPADVVKDMGADFVIAVSLSNILSNEGIKIGLDSVYKGNKIPICDRLTKGLSAADVVISPDLSGFRSTSLSGANEMFSIGYEAALSAIPEIKEKLKKKKMKLF